MSNEILEKVVATTEADANKKGGFLAPAQVNQFIDYMFDATVLGGQIRRETVRSDSAELTRIGVGQRLLRRATEAVDDGVNVGVAFSKIALSTSKFRLDWELSTESLEDGREGTDFEDHVARLMAAQVANDMEDYAINGDTTVSDDPGIGTMPGWGQRLRNTGHIVDAGGDTLDRDLLSAMMRALPRHHKQGRANMKYFASSNALQDLLDAEYDLARDININAGITDVAGPLGYQAPRVNGQAIQEVPLFSDDKVGTHSGAGNEGKFTEVWLTDPKNLIWAVKREIQVYREFKPKKDSIEYTLYTRFGTAVENGDAAVIATNVGIAE